MNGIENVQLKKVIIHKIGNPSRGEELGLSENELVLDDELIRSLLTKYFLAAFNPDEQYEFTHISDIGLNEVYNYVTGIFNDATEFIPLSKLLAEFLYNKSTHVKVKEGELYVTLFEKIPFGERLVDAVGIFKSETRETFLKVFRHDNSWDLSSEEGVSIHKLDKGCIIFKTDKDTGYKLCVIDTTNKQNDAQYWISGFLQIKPVGDSYHNTDKYLSLCKNFITNEYADKFEVTKSDQIELLNRSMDYFKTKEQFNLREFAEEVIHHDEVKDSFMQYKKNFESSRSFEMEDEFDIHLSAVKKQAKVFKSVLKLDRNFHIYIHGRRDLIEKGIDENTGKKFYKIYYEEET